MVLHVYVLARCLSAVLETSAAMEIVLVAGPLIVSGHGVQAKPHTLLVLVVRGVQVVVVLLSYDGSFDLWRF